MISHIRKILFVSSVLLVSLVGANKTNLHPNLILTGKDVIEINAPDQKISAFL